MFLTRCFVLSVVLTKLFVLASCAKYKYSVWDFQGLKPSYNTFSFNGLNTRYYEAGSGDPIILIHGFAASSYTWRHVSPALAERFKVIGFDLKGFGASDKPNDSQYSPDDQAEILAKFIQANNMKHVSLIGHSFGGAVAIMTYIRIAKLGGDDVVKALILIDTISDNQELPVYVRIASTPLVTNLGLLLLPKPILVKFGLRKAFYDNSKVNEAMIDAYSREINLPGSRNALAQTARFVVSGSSRGVLPTLKDIQVPVLLIWGEQDEIVPLPNGIRLAKENIQTGLVVIPNCGHIPQEETPAQVVLEIVNFLARE